MEFLDGRPPKVGEVWRANGPRIKRYFRAMLPFLLTLAALVLSLIAMAVVAGCRSSNRMKG
jgi:hypothetical protein